MAVTGVSGGMPLMDFSELGNLGKTYDDARRTAVRERTLADLGKGGGPIDYGAGARALLAAGDTEGGLSLARLAQSQSTDARDFAFREAEARRAQGNTERQLTNAEKVQSPEYIGTVARTRAVVDSEFAPKTTNIKTPGGDEFTVEKGPTGYRLPQVAGAPTDPANPFAYGKQNETQSKDSGFANRMFRAEGVLRDPKVEAAAQDVMQNLAGKMPGMAGNYLTSADYQKFDQAKRDFVNAVLRRESGAAISSSEFDNATKQYFPQPGDKPERLAEKRKNRQDAIAGVAGGGGQSYKPPATFDEVGNMVPTGAPRQGVRPAPPGPMPAQAPAQPGAAAGQLPSGVTADAAVAQARAAIAAGRDPAGVKAKLQSFGIDVSGL